jgi:hypothetical protein
MQWSLVGSKDTSHPQDYPSSGIIAQAWRLVALNMAAEWQSKKPGSSEALAYPIELYGRDLFYCFQIEIRTSQRLC